VRIPTQYHKSVSRAEWFPSGRRARLARASPAAQRQILSDWIIRGTVEPHPDGYKVTLVVLTPKGLLADDPSARGMVTPDTKGTGALCAGAHELTFTDTAPCGRVARSLSAIR